MIGAGMRVHSELGPGFLEPVYREALAMEFVSRAIPFEKEPWLRVYYRGQLLPTHYRADFVCFDSVLVECEALKRLSSAEESQVLNYLKAATLGRAILLNFGGPQLEWKRMVWTAPKSGIPMTREEADSQGRQSRAD